jgi:flotillin
MTARLAVFFSLEWMFILAAATPLLTGKLEQIVGLQVEAIRNIRIEKVTVWDGGGKDGTATAQFLPGLVKSLPPLHEVAGLAWLADPGPDRPC